VTVTGKVNEDHSMAGEGAVHQRIPTSSPCLGVHLLDCLPGGGHIRVEMVPEVPGATLPPSASQGWSHANHNVTAAHGGLVCKKAPSLRSQHLPPVSAVAPLGSE